MLFGQIQIGSDIDGEFADDFSGQSVSLSSDGNIVAIGAPLNRENGINYGHVRVYENNGGIWTQIGSDINGEDVNENIGSSLSISSNGRIVAIASESFYGSSVSGFVRVYENIGGVWIKTGGDINGQTPGDTFGFSLSLSSDGNTLAIGARYNGSSNEGYVEVYENIGGVWNKTSGDINGQTSGDEFGSSIAISSDGNIVGIGAPSNDGNGSNSGHVQVYENINDVWIQIGSDIDGEAPYDESGNSLSMSSDGNIVAIGAQDNNNDGANSGHVRVYENQSGTWTQIGSDIDGQASSDLFGSSVSLSSDGSILAVGAIFNDGNGTNSGQVRVYKNINGFWIQRGTVINGEASGDFLGVDVSLSSNGNILAIGASNNDGNGSNSGHVRVYDLSLVLLDDDDDGVKNNVDQCPETPNGEAVDVNGCSENQLLDDDNDDIKNYLDQCPDTPNGETVDDEGCSDSQLDDDNDGVMNDEDQCPNTSLNTSVDIKGCILFPEDNLNVQTIGETCPDKDNGKIIISSNETYNYTATLNDVEYDFTTDLTIDNLASGNYELCVTIPSESYEQCYTISLAEGTTIAGRTSINSGVVSVNIERGTAPYNIVKNGELILLTDSSEFSIDATHGDVIEVSTSKSCEGSFSETITFIDAVLAYPNPTTTDIEIILPKSTIYGDVNIEIYNVQSQLIEMANCVLDGNKLKIDMRSFANGIYFVKLNLKESIIIKILKQ